MSRYLIAYDLSKEKREYDALDAQIRTLDSNLARVLESTWLLESDKSPQEILDALKKTDTEQNNHYLVIGVSAPWAALRPRTDAILRKWFPEGE